MRTRISLAIGSIALAGSLQAATFTVTNTNDSGAGSLRQAILDANANPGLDTINFNITGSGLHTIQPLSTMTISDPVVINGFSQTGSSPNTLLVGNNAVYTIEIDGSGIPAGSDLFHVFTSGATIRGLLINRSNGLSIFIDQTDTDNKVIGNWIGTDVTGTQLLGSSSSAVRVYGSNNHVGGTDPGDHNVLVGGSSSGTATVDISLGGFNVIQGNLVGLNAAGTAVLATSPPPSYGISLAASPHDTLIGGTVPGARNVVFANAAILLGSGSSHSTVQGNYLGTDATGTMSLGETVGIFTNNHPQDNLIGGSAPGAGNVISGNVEGITFTDGASTNTVMGNFIGTDPTGLLPVPNAGHGIRIQTPSVGSVIGGVNPGEGNTIAFNGGAGVLVSSQTDWPIRGNSIHGNGVGIDLGGDGVTPNDVSDADDGPNHGQNFPILKAVTILSAPQGTGTRIQGKLDSTPSTIFDLDFYSNPACAKFPRELLQGETYLGSSQVTTDGTGHADIDVTLPATILPGERVSATATDPAGNTSEFSQRIIFSISPASGPAAGGSFVGVSGTDFSNPTTIAIGGADAAGSFVDDHTLTATSPAFAPGTFHDVVATTTDGTTGTLVNGYVADFLDVPAGHQFYTFVTTLVSNTITVGVGNGLYGVDLGTKRQQMAVFLLKAEHGLCYAPPPCVGTFPDVPCPSNFAPWIEALAAEGITTGCGGGNFCPDNLVTRRQMAVFLLKTEHGSSYVPPACAGVFDDVACPGAPAVDFIEQLAAEQITGGCSASPPLYCPDGTSTRGQMAVFITKTFHLQ